MALADCKGLLERRMTELDRILIRGRQSGLSGAQADTLLPLTQEVVTLRRRRLRLELELRAIAGEWAINA